MISSSGGGIAAVFAAAADTLRRGVVALLHARVAGARRAGGGAPTPRPLGNGWLAACGPGGVPVGRYRTPSAGKLSPWERWAHRDPPDTRNARVPYGSPQPARSSPLDPQSTYVRALPGEGGRGPHHGQPLVTQSAASAAAGAGTSRVTRKAQQLYVPRQLPRQADTGPARRKIRASSSHILRKV